MPLQAFFHDAGEQTREHNGCHRRLHHYNQYLLSVCRWCRLPSAFHLVLWWHIVIDIVSASAKATSAMCFNNCWLLAADYELHLHVNKRFPIVFAVHSIAPFDCNRIDAIRLNVRDFSFPASPSPYGNSLLFLSYFHINHFHSLSNAVGR